MLLIIGGVLLGILLLLAIIFICYCLCCKVKRKRDKKTCFEIYCGCCRSPCCPCAPCKLDPDGPNSSQYHPGQPGILIPPSRDDRVPIVPQIDTPSPVLPDGRNTPSPTLSGSRSTPSPMLPGRPHLGAPTPPVIPGGGSTPPAISGSRDTLPSRGSGTSDDSDDDDDTASIPEDRDPHTPGTPNIPPAPLQSGAIVVPPAPEYTFSIPSTPEYIPRGQQDQISQSSVSEPPEDNDRDSVWSSDLLPDTPRDETLYGDNQIPASEILPTFVPVHDASTTMQKRENNMPSQIQKQETIVPAHIQEQETIVPTKELLQNAAAKELTAVGVTDTATILEEESAPPGARKVPLIEQQNDSPGPSNLNEKIVAITVEEDQSKQEDLIIPSSLKEQTAVPSPRYQDGSVGDDKRGEVKEPQGAANPKLGSFSTMDILNVTENFSTPERIVKNAAEVPNISPILMMSSGQPVVAPLKPISNEEIQHKSSSISNSGKSKRKRERSKPYKTQDKLLKQNQSSRIAQNGALKSAPSPSIHVIMRTDIEDVKVGFSDTTEDESEKPPVLHLDTLPDFPDISDALKENSKRKDRIYFDKKPKAASKYRVTPKRSSKVQPINDSDDSYS